MPNLPAPSSPQPTPSRATRTVVWTIELDSDDATDAAVQALEITRDPASVATVFRVYEPDGSSTLIDVEDPAAPQILGAGGAIGAGT